MLSVPPTVKVFLAPGTTDLRKSFDALAAATRIVMSGDPHSGHLFAFCGRRRHLVKILYWDGSGFWMFSKRLARGTFSWPQPSDAQRVVELRGDELMVLVSGVDLAKTTWRSWWRSTPASVSSGSIASPDGRKTGS